MGHNGSKVTRMQEAFQQRPSPIESASLQEQDSILEDEKHQPVLDYTSNCITEEGKESIRKLCRCTSQVQICEDERDYLNFPFLKDPSVIQYISQSKVMFIMRGLPGSGKSTITKCLEKVYPDSVKCSSDDFFYQDGRYNFDAKLLGAAHESCQLAARSAAEDQTPVIIIDNTNIQFWEMKYYISLSRAFNYVCLIVEPRTPWSRNANVLSQKNSHSVGIDVIQKKLKIMKNIYPIYYGWFINETDSALLQQMALTWLQRLLNERKIFEEFSKLTKLETIQDMLQYYEEGRYPLTKLRIIHCTSKFTLNKDEPDVLDYMDHPVIQQNISTVHRLNIIGYVITPRAFGARISLNSKQLTLWGGDDAQFDAKEPPKKPQSNEKKSHSNFKSRPNSKGAPIPKYEIELSDLTPKATVAVVPQDTGTNRFHPTRGKGSRAHFTLGTAKDVSPVTTGFDLVNVVSLESHATNNGNESFIEYKIPDAVVRGYGNGIYVIYPEKKAELDSLFGYYL